MNDAAGRLIGVEPDEQRPLVGGAHRLLGQHAPDLIGLFVPGTCNRLPDLLLARMIGR